MKGSATTYEGYEVGDWEFFRDEVERLGDTPGLSEFLTEWQLDYPPTWNAENITDDMAFIIDRLTPEGSQG